MILTTQLFWNLIQKEMKEHDLDFTTASYEIQKIFIQSYSTNDYPTTDYQNRLISTLTSLRDANKHINNNDVMKCYYSIRAAKKTIGEE